MGINIINLTGEMLDLLTRVFKELTAEEFNTTTFYKQFDVVKKDGILYLCMAFGTTTGEWQANRWQLTKIYDQEGIVLTSNEATYENPEQEDNTVNLQSVYNVNKSENRLELT